MSHHDSQSEHQHHIIPLRYYFVTFAALIILTILTVAVAQFNLGEWNIVAALVVAVLKATLVALFFMGLRWDKGFNGLILIGTFLFLAIFIGLTSADIFTRHDTDPLEVKHFGFHRPLPTAVEHSEQGEAPSSH